MEGKSYFLLWLFCLTFCCLKHWPKTFYSCLSSFLIPQYHFLKYFPHFSSSSPISSLTPHFRLIFIESETIVLGSQNSFGLFLPSEFGFSFLLLKSLPPNLHTFSRIYSLTIQATVFPWLWPHFFILTLSDSFVIFEFVVHKFSNFCFTALL